jgi:hypothetical protein
MRAIAPECWRLNFSLQKLAMSVVGPGASIGAYPVETYEGPSCPAFRKVVRITEALGRATQSRLSKLPLRVGGLIDDRRDRPFAQGDRSGLWTCAVAAVLQFDVPDV